MLKIRGQLLDILSTSMMLFIRLVEITISSKTGTLPPTSPVLPA